MLTPDIEPATLARERAMSPGVRPPYVAAAILAAAIGGAAVGIWLSPAHVDLSSAERSVYSAAGEDGVIEKIFEVVGVRRRFLVDLATADQLARSSSRNLILNRGWSGLLVQATTTGEEPPYADPALTRARVLRGLVDPGSVELLLEGEGVPRDLDLLIIQLKANDWHVWRAIQDWRPAVVQIQYNGAFAPPQRMVVEYHPFNRWDGRLYFGASIQSLYELGRRKGYELLYANRAGTTLFFVDGRRGVRGFAGEDPALVYHPDPTLPIVQAQTLWNFVDLSGHPLQGRDPEVGSLRIPRRFVVDSK